MGAESFTVILFFSSSYALRAEKLLASAKLASRMIPIPRHLSSNCGVCIRIRQEDRQPAIAILELARLPIEGVHDL